MSMLRLYWYVVYLLPLVLHHLLRLPNHLVHCLGEIINVVCVQASHGDASILRHVDMRVFANLENLLLGEPSEAEHANLISDMVPCAGGTHFLELTAQCSAHFLDAA